MAGWLLMELWFTIRMVNPTEAATLTTNQPFGDICLFI